jgi:hypothetical protein
MIAAAPAMPLGRLGLLAAGGIALLAGLAGSLALLGLPIVRGGGHLAAAHGLLMALGFLGTLITLERAVALRRSWGFVGPIACGLGGLVLVGGGPPVAAAALLAVGAATFVAMYVAFLQIERSLHTGVQAAGAVACLGATLILLAGRPASAAVPLLAAFLVLTIVGERLELSRVVRLSDRARVALVGVAGVFAAGVGLSVAAPGAGTRVAGLAMIGLAAWLSRNDVARRTVRTSGLPRFVALALLAGYVWLAVAGFAWLAFGAVAPGPARDASLHALFLGFVMSMVFGHAPVILPAVLHVPLPFTRRFYAHLALMHLGLVVRVLVGDLGGLAAAWQVGGVLNVLALLLFVASSALASGLALRRRAGSRGSTPAEVRPTANEASLST